jgi:hypothetical protein
VAVAWPVCNCLYTHPAVDPLVNEPLVQPASPLNFLNLLIAGEPDWRSKLNEPEVHRIVFYIIFITNSLQGYELFHLSD